MARGKDYLGTSPFTHQDDAGADIHTTDPEGVRHLFYGEPMTPKAQLQEIVLGPGAFGSPDPRTLGHVMLPVSGEPVSAAELDADWVAENREGATVEGETAEGEDTQNYSGMNKAELLEEAEKRSLDVDETNTKAEILDALEADDSNT